ncbi:Heat-stable enterotoxin receptor [Thoreauomyces humboldtii]|nr:Heat-stable enterotoxin receptor [Thoreauomyces humboldtii]
MTSTAQDMVVAGGMALHSGAHSATPLNGGQAAKTSGSGSITIVKADDEELQRALKLMKMEDTAMTLALEQERSTLESSMERIHRMNNFRIDEAHIREANIAESRFLLETQNAERAALAAQDAEDAAMLKEEEADKRMLEMLMRELRSLKMNVRTKAASAERVMSVKRKMAERRAANQLRLSGIEVRQERERKALQDSHTRIMKNMTLFRNLLLQEVEDAELAEYLAEGNITGNKAGRRSEVGRLEADKMHQSKILQLKLRMQKEVEQLREEHLMKLKHISKICELELDQTEESQTLFAEHKIQELELEMEQQKELESEEDQIAQQRATLKAFQTQRNLQTKAIRTLGLQRYEARQLTRQQKVAAKHRERQYFASEEALRESLREMAEDDDGMAHRDVEGGDNDRRLDQLGSARQSASAMSEMSFSDNQSEMSEMTTDSHAETTLDDEEAGAALDAENLEAEDSVRKERGRIELLHKRHLEGMETLRVQHREIRDQAKREHMQQTSVLLGEQETEFKKLKIQHHKETEALLKTQSAATALEDDNKGANELLYGMLPRYVADAMKMGQEVPPRDFACVTLLLCDIVQFTNLTANSSPDQIVNLLNRLYTAFDAILDDYADLYKTETIGDAYQIVAGLNSDTTSSLEHSTRRNAIDTVDAAVRFIDEVKNLDMSDQIQRELFIRIGVHSGPCVGGVAGVTMPKFAIFGDSATVAGQMEQKSAPNRIHISAPTYDLVKDADFVFEKTAQPVTLEGGVTFDTYWVLGRKNVKTAVQPTARGLPAPKVKKSVTMR